VTSFHIILSTSILLTSLILLPTFMVSSSSDLFQVFFLGGGRQPSLWLQSSAYFSMDPVVFLGVWPIYSNFLFFVWTRIACRFVIIHKFLFDIRFGHLILIIHRKQQLMKTYSGFAICRITSHVPQAYRRTDFALVQKIRSVVLLQMFQLLHRGVQW
jgi:hypothetical protein